MFRVLFLILVLMGSSAFSLFSKPPSPIPKSVAPIPAPTSPFMLDTIGKSSDKDLIARFEALKFMLTKEPDTIGYIINYGTKSQIRKREKQIRKALDFHKINSKRAVIVKGLDRDYLETVIYIVPANVEPPSI